MVITENSSNEFSKFTVKWIMEKELLSKLVSDEKWV
jgi:hypothetical protein